MAVSGGTERGRHGSIRNDVDVVLSSRLIESLVETNFLAESVDIDGNPPDDTSPSSD